jgi:hypothetical protein
MNERIVKKIADLVRTSHSDAYIQAVIWGMRTSTTSMTDINNAISIFRLFYKKEIEDEN